jgi:hypothetical protein
MLAALMIGFTLLGTGVGAYRAYRRQWVETARIVVSCALAVAAYASILLHEPWIAAIAGLVGIATTVPYAIYMWRHTRRT